MTTTKLALATLTALCLGLLGGCDGGKSEAKDGKAAKDAKVESKGDAKADAKAGDVKAPEAKAPEAKADDGKAPDAKAPEAGAGGDAAAKIGVAECDEYIAKMSACIASGGVAAEHLEAQKMGLEMYQKSWADAIKSNPADGPALVPGCKAAIEMGKVSHPTCFQ